MEDVMQDMTMGEWCVLSYQACHLGEPGARLRLARLYKNCPHIEDNMRYALFWLVKSYESDLRQGETNVNFAREVREEINEVAEALSDKELSSMQEQGAYLSKFSFGLMEQSAAADGDLEEVCPSTMWIFSPGPN